MFNTIEPNQITQYSNDQEIFLIDIRSRKEFQNDGLSGSIHIEYHTLPNKLDKIPKDKTVVLIANDAEHAGAARNFIKGYGKFSNIYALEQGIVGLQDFFKAKKVG